MCDDGILTRAEAHMHTHTCTHTHELKPHMHLPTHSSHVPEGGPRSYTHVALVLASMLAPSEYVSVVNNMRAMLPSDSTYV